MFYADTVNVFDEKVAQQLKYVAVSRAKEDVYIVTSNNINEPVIENQDMQIEQKESIEQSNNYTLHSGGARGSDTIWGEIGKKYNVKLNHYYSGDKTPNGNIEIFGEDKVEGQQKATIAARQMGRIEPNQQVKNELLIRDWAQVKYADAVFAITTMLSVGDEMNYGKKAKIRQGKGGTGYAIQMAINENKPVYVYDQVRKQWFSNINGKWSKSDIPVLTNNFAGIGTREINQDGIQAIKDVYSKTFVSEQKSEESTKQDIINIYYGANENADLSNFAVRPFEYQGLEFNTVEGAFQFAKLNYAGEQIEDENGRTVADEFLDPNLTGAQARSLGRRIQNLNTEEWDANSSRIMKEIIKISFEQNPQAKQRLLDTGNAIFTHTQDKSKWGKEFPKILMEVRDEIKQESKQGNSFLSRFSTFDRNAMNEMNNEGKLIADFCKGKTV